MSLPNGSVTMKRATCAVCTPANGPEGLDCECGKHFHVGFQLLAGINPIFCPRCEGACLPSDVDQLDSGELPPRTKGEEELLVAVLDSTDLPREVLEGVKAVVDTRRSTDPQYWINVTLRESWKHEHGSYEGWDKNAVASGQDPTIYGPAA